MLFYGVLREVLEVPGASGGVCFEVTLVGRGGWQTRSVQSKQGSEQSGGDQKR